MADLLREYDLKRRRAIFHRDALAEAVERVVESQRHIVRGEPDVDAGKYIFHVPLQPVDPDIAVILGDWVYDIRASLDYLITALIRSAGNDESETSQFPIYGIDRIYWQKIDKWWDDDPRGTIERNLDGTPTGTKAALKPLQPFYGVPAVDPARHPLFGVQVMSNRDKHRRLNLIAHHAELVFTDADGKPLFEGIPLDARIAEPREGDAYAVTLNADVDSDVDMYLLATHDVRLHEPPELIGELIETLFAIHEFIDGRVVPVVRSLMT